MSRSILIRLANWTKIKFRIHTSEKEPVFFREKEIWWASLGSNIGYEQDGKNENFERPILILKKYNKDMLLVVPLTSKEKAKRYYHKFKYKSKKEIKDGNAILNQMRTISSKRLLRYIGIVQKSDFLKIKDRIKKEFL